MLDGDESEKLRGDDDDDENRQGRRPSADVEGEVVVVGQTTQIKAYPGTAQAYYAVLPLAVLGQAAEGQPATYTQFGSPILAANVGGAVPPIGTRILCTFINHRWVFRYDG